MRPPLLLGGRGVVRNGHLTLTIVLGLAVGFTWMKAAGGKLVAARLRVPPVGCETTAPGIAVGAT